MTSPLPSDAVQKLKEWANERVFTNLGILERTMDADETAITRGRLRELRHLLEWIEPKSAPSPEPESRRLSAPPHY